MRRLALPAIGTLIALAIAACSTGPGPGPGGPPANTIDVTASLSPDASLSTVELGGGESQVFRVDVPQDVVDAGLLYVELNRDVDLEVMTSGYGTVTFSASSRDYFGSGTQGLGPAALGLDPQAVDTPVTCRGSCVLLEPANPGVVYVRVTNEGSSTNVSLYVYGDQHADEYEPDNDQPAGAPTFAFTDAGAIETVGDVDYWYFDQNTTVMFDVVTVGIPLEADIVDASGTPVQNSDGPYIDGDEIQLYAGEYLRVWSVEPWQAASSARSTYYLEDVEPLGSSSEEATRRR